MRNLPTRCGHENAIANELLAVICSKLRYRLRQGDSTGTYVALQISRPADRLGGHAPSGSGRQETLRTGHQLYRDTAFGWALRDTSGFCRLYADPATGELLGAHILGYQAPSLIQPLIQAMSSGQNVASMARGQYWIHPALSEVVENALLKLPLNPLGQSDLR